MQIEDEFQGLKVAVVCSTLGTGEVGGAERFYHGLLQALLEQGCDARMVNVKADESSYEQIRRNYDYCRDLDLSAFDMVISTKAPTYAIRHPRHVLYLVHTTRVFYDMFEQTFPWADHVLKNQRATIQQLDTELISGIEARYCIGHEVSERLLKFNGLESEVLHPPLGFNEFYCGDTGDYFFIPGRLHPWKRLDLLIAAVQRSNSPMKLKIAGTGEAQESLRELAAGDKRIEFLGRVSDAKLLEFYANALAVPFVPEREDYGYITLEAFASGKPVITCSDSGEPMQFVEDGVTGLICEPDPAAIATAMETLFNNPESARDMGLAARQVVDAIQWPAVARQLLEAGMAGDAIPQQAPAGEGKTRVAVLDMQPIDPPVGGGRLRLLGLYHHLGDNYETRYVGSYDWEGEDYRRHWLSDTLEEIDVPLSKEHHRAAAELAQKCGGKVVIDLTFPQLGELSPEYLAEARTHIEWADVVVFSHPWLYPLLKDDIRPGHLVVYDSQNVESFLRAQILDQGNPPELEVLRGVIECEHRLGNAADLVLACSQDDLQLFNRIYEWNPEKIKLAPNGVFTSRILPASVEDRAAARKALGTQEATPVAIFLGSNYKPNVEAAQFIARDLAPHLEDVLFVVAGGVGTGLQPDELPSNVVITGFLEEQDKSRWLQAADIAINPMFSGSGTNIKMFDFMASGLPTITTEIGARGIESAGGEAMMIVEPTIQAYVDAIAKLVHDESQYQACAEAARKCVEDGYSWEHISPTLGHLVAKTRSGRLHGRLKYSIVIPSYERHGQLEELIAFLQRQTYKYFEVIIVDQSAEKWDKAGKNYGFPLFYHHTEVKGAVRARNTGAQFANGEIIAFTDDDCRPESDWLENCIKYFDDPGTVCVEGKIYSDHVDDPDYRPVTNVGFEGFGFMTANLLVRHTALKMSGGFDLQFDHPHFREDTDLGWRLQQIGHIPYGDDVRVFHPAQKRSQLRESLEQRAAFFEKDALLYRKHPTKYWELFHAEGHWARDNGFWTHFVRGAAKYGVDISPFQGFMDSQS